MTFIKFLRDPLWQALGVLVAVVAIFISIVSTAPFEGELSLVRYQTIKFSDYYLPNDRVKLIFGKTTKDFDKSVIDYYWIANSKPNAIRPDDFNTPFTITKGAAVKNIMLVESCSTPIGQALTAEGALNTNAYKQLTWNNKNGVWTATPILLNPSDQACVIVIYEPAIGAKKEDRSLIWNTAIANVKFKIYASLQDYADNASKSWKDYLSVTVSLEGTAIYWFVLLQAVVFGATIVLAGQANWLYAKSKQSVRRLIFIMLICTSTAEILVDTFINRRFQNPIAWPLLAIHIIFIVYLITKAVRVRKGMQKLLTHSPQIEVVDE
jgi:hypothetical protein